MKHYHSGENAATQKLRNQGEAELSCTCPGCYMPRLRRFEELNAQLAREVDRLRQANMSDLEVAA